jgi:hypothetical protein
MSKVSKNSQINIKGNVTLINEKMEVDYKGSYM